MESEEGGGEMESEQGEGGGREARGEREGGEERERVSSKCPVLRGDDEGKTQCIHLVTIS